MRRPTRLHLALVAGLLVLAACSGSDNDTASDTATAPTTVETTDAPATTQAPDTTAAPETTVAETTAPETTEPPTPACPPADPLPAGENVFTITVDGREREYMLYVPESLDADSPAPLVFNLHGRGSNRAEQALYGGFLPLADRDGWLVAHPQGITPEGQSAQQWNFAQVFDATYSDEAFILAVIEDVAAKVCVDRDRIYSSGMSSGGFMSSALACLHGDVFAAVAPVAGTFFDDRCDSDDPVPYLTFHGEQDDVVPFEGFGIATAAASWAERNGCDPDPTEVVIGNTTARTWTCPAGGETAIYVASDGGHTWPGFPIDIPGLGFTNRDVVATELIWEFFGRHSLAAG
jgi:polyhydroxybutyrate depolymerase